MKSQIIALALLLVLGVVAIATKFIWLFIVPLVIVAILILKPQKDKQVDTDDDEEIYDEDIETEAIDAEDEEKRLMAEYEELLAEKKRLMEQEPVDDEIDDDDDIDWDNEKFDDDDDFPVIENEPISPTKTEPVAPIKSEPVAPIESEPVSAEIPSTDELDDLEDLLDEIPEIDDLEDLLLDEAIEEVVEEVVEEIAPPIVKAPIATDPNQIVMHVPDNFVKGEDDEKTLEKLVEAKWQELDNLVGLEQLKTDLRKNMNLLIVQQKKKAQGLNTAPITLHMTFLGDAGTGKTTVARIIGQLYKGMGILSSGHLVETDRSGLVASYVGQTAQKTNEIIQKAMGGVLFIDEAYALANGGAQDYGQEAIDTLIKGMEDYRDKFVVILAGYEEDMKKLFAKNQGFESRVRNHYKFENYSVEELMKLAMITMKKDDLQPTQQAMKVLKAYFEHLYEKDGFVKGNGRTVRNIIDEIKVNQSTRIVETNTDDYVTVLPEDISYKLESTESPVDEPKAAQAPTIAPPEEKAVDEQKQREKDELELLEELL